MYSNIGEKLKKLAIFQMIIGSIGGIVAGIALINISMLVGIIVIIVSPLFSWVSSLITYGVGEAADSKEYGLYRQGCDNGTTSLSKLRDSAPLFRDEESERKTKIHTTILNQNHNTDYANENEKLLLNAIEVSVDNHNEGFCPKCRAIVAFDNSFGAKSCHKCRTLIKPRKNNN